jgi:hypothetical protein
MLGHIYIPCAYTIYIYLNVFGIFPRGPQKVTVPKVRIHFKTQEFSFRCEKLPGFLCISPGDYST